jgi:hypothetical protein
MASTSSGSAASDIAVNVTRSQNREVTTLRSCGTTGADCSEAPPVAAQPQRPRPLRAAPPPYTITLGPYETCTLTSPSPTGGHPRA